MIDVKVRKKLGEFILDVELKDEGFICLAGKNGSGKSTLLNIVAGFMNADQGYVRIDSNDVTRATAEKRSIVLINPDSYLPYFDVDKHLLWGAKLQKRKVHKGKIDQIKRGLGVDYGGRVSELSLGMKERVSLATALLASPKVILVDEAFANIDNRTDFINSYREYSSASGIDVIFSSQQNEDSKQADHFYRIDHGRVLREF